MAKCNQCGHIIEGNVNFCSECGNPIGVSSTNDHPKTKSSSKHNSLKIHTPNAIKMLDNPLKFTVTIPVVQERSAESKATATLLMGFVGFAATSGKILHKQMDGYVSTHEKGIKISFGKKYAKDVKIEWDKIVDVKKRGVLTKEIVMYLINEDYLTFRFGSINKLYPVIKENMSGVIQENLEEKGWD